MKCATFFCILLLPIQLIITDENRKYWKDCKRLKHCLRHSNVTVVTRNDPQYEKLNDNWNIRIVIEPKGFLLPFSSNDVQNIVYCAKILNLNIVPKGGGHSFEKYSFGSIDHWVIDMQNFNYVIVDEKTKTARIGVGIKMKQMAIEVISKGFLLPIGACMDNGVAGYTLGGGHGYTVRSTGLMIQRLKEVKIVTSDAHLRTANNDIHGDLFWALKGAGADSFGIVSEFTFNLLPLPTLIVISKIYSIEQFSTIFTIWSLWIDSDPNNSITAALTVNVPEPGVLLSVAINSGSLMENKANIDEVKSRFPDINNENIVYQTYNESLRTYGLNSRKVYFKSVNYYGKQPFTSEQRKILTSAVDELLQKCAYCGLILQQYRGKIMENKDNAFIHKDAYFDVVALIQVPVISEINGENIARQVGASMLPHLNEFTRATRSVNSGFSYQNYIDRNWTDWRKRYFGSLYDTLTSIKKKYDPLNLFSCPQCVGR